MTIPYRLPFDQLEWETPMEGVRHKYLDRDGQRIRLVEYSREMPVHGCDRGHLGYLISGEMEIEFPDSTVICREGDGIVIPDGPDHRHRARILSEKALAFFIEKT